MHPCLQPTVVSYKEEMQAYEIAMLSVSTCVLSSTSEPTDRF